MSSSIVHRERLIGPVGLMLLVGLFALAFFVLKPSSVPGDSVAVRLEQSDWSEAAVSSLDELDIAYIKAKYASGDISDENLIKLILSMMQLGRTAEAGLMLSQYPTLQVDAQSRTLMDLELAAAQSREELGAALESLVGQRRLHSVVMLERAIVLSKRLQRPRLTQELYLALAAGNDVDKARAYQRCGDFLVQRRQLSRAIGCYASALKTVSDDTQGQARGFDIQLVMLTLLPPSGAEQQALVNSLLNDVRLSVPQSRQLSEALLAAERPDAAYRVHARLAKADHENANYWLAKAARWAQAANQLSDAALFFDALAKASEGKQRQRYLKDVIRVLVAAGEDNKALNKVKRQLSERHSSALSSAQRDEQLANGIALARQLGNTEQALTWNTQRLSLNPGNPDLLALQGELALAASDLPLAYEAARQAVELTPENISARENLARVSEWNGKPVEASKQWFWLSRAKNQSDEPERRKALRELVRLAQATFQNAKAANALRELTLLEKPVEEDVLQLVSLFEMDGLPEEAASALNDIIVIHGWSPFVLRTLALQQYRNGNYPGSLGAWRQYEQHYGNSSEAVIYQMELLWRLDEKARAADVAQKLRGHTLLSQASDYQLRLLAEIAWQYRKPWLTELVRPSLNTLEEYDMRAKYGRRSLESLKNQGNDNLALVESVRLWQSTGQTYFALSAMQLAMQQENPQVLEEFLPDHGASAALKREPDYWTRLAKVRLRSNEKVAARDAYSQALKLSPGHIDSMVGTLWLDIAEAEPEALQDSLRRFADVADTEPTLWQAMAVGHLQAGDAAASVQWFDRLLDQMDSDYGMLLTYADALDYSGRVADAERVRRYALVQLRPILVSGSVEQQSKSLRQLANLSSRYGTASENEALMNRLLSDLQANDYDDSQEAIWREDIAISWLMSTQRHEQARLVMANLHASRLEAPVWQRLALALNAKDNDAIQAIVRAKGPMSVGNHILALRQLGLDHQAYALAQKALRPDALNPQMSASDKQTISGHYASLRAVFPSYVSASFATRDVAGISSSRRGVSVRHSFAGYPLGVGLDVSQRRLTSTGFDYDGDDELGEVALSLFFGNSLQGGRITAGLITADEGDQGYASARLHLKDRSEKRLYSVEAAYKESLSNSGELYLAAHQNRATASIDASLGALPYIRLQADATQINTREGNQRFADGLAVQAEAGVRGQHAGHSWTASVLAGQIRYQRSDTLPAQLQLRSDSSVQSILQEQTRRLSIGGSVSRGDVNSGFTQSGTARYFIDARLGRSWPSSQLGLSANAGAGIRVLGGDELSFTVSHETQGVSKRRGAFTSMGVNYRYHF